MGSWPADWRAPGLPRMGSLRLQGWLGPCSWLSMAQLQREVRVTLHPLKETCLSSSAGRRLKLYSPLD